MQSTLPAGKPACGIGYDSVIGWYAWFGHSPTTGVRVPLKILAKPFKTAGTAAKTVGPTMPLFMAAVLVGVSAGWLMERRARSQAEEAHAFESTRASVAEKDRDEARSKAEDMDAQIKLLVYSLVNIPRDYCKR